MTNENVNFDKPLYQNGRYSHPKSFGEWSLPNVPAAIKYFVFTKKRNNLPRAKTQLDVILPIRRPDFEIADSSCKTLKFTWLGHATNVIQIDGINVITDPIWADHASPISFAGAPRYRPPPCSIDDLPPIDVVVISHNHYDHLDADAVQRIHKTFPHAHFFVPMGLKRTLTDWGISDMQVTQLTWGDEVTYKASRTNLMVRVVCVPAQHWSQRGMFDRFKTLWSGWAILGSRHRFYFAGDTGLCADEFRKLGQLYGPFDVSAIPIGCYEPREFMGPQHIGPLEAVQIHKLVRSTKSIGIHWGTFNMSSAERYNEPREYLARLVKENLQSTEEFITTDHGQTIEID